jgi:hypothetical protein
MQRALLLTGPAIITWNGGTFFSQGDIVASFAQENFDVNVSSLGNVSTRQAERQIKIEFTPSGEWSGEKGYLFPYASYKPGQSIFGASDKPLIIKTLDGTKSFTFNNVALTRMPSIFFHPLRTMTGPVEFTALGPDNKEWDAVLAADQLFTISDLTAPTFADFTESDILTRPYSIAWAPSGITGFNPFETEEGFQVDFELDLVPKGVSSDGIIDYRFRNLIVTARCNPVGPTEAELTAALRLQGTGAGRGRSLSAVMADMIVTDKTTDTEVFRAKNMALASSQMVHGDIANRHASSVWRSQRKITAGVPDAWFVVA